MKAVVVDAAGRRLPMRRLAGWLERVAPARARGVVTVALVADGHIRSLNRRFRGFDKVTDVLSFQAVPDLERAPRPFVPQLGDIVIARGRAAQQARDLGHSVLAELRVLALHGLLHLLGYDHERDNGQMRRVEERLRREGGLGHGLIARNHRAGEVPAHATSATRRRSPARSRRGRIGGRAGRLKAPLSKR